jgi:hypothetical protein
MGRRTNYSCTITGRLASAPKFGFTAEGKARVVASIATDSGETLVIEAYGIHARAALLCLPNGARLKVSGELAGKTVTAGRVERR